jgi:hypothetical protein
MKQRCNNYLELPAQHLTLVSAFNDRSRRVKRQIFLLVKLGSVPIDHVFLVSPQLLTSVFLGIHFFINTSASINFPERCAVFQADNEKTTQLFDVTNDDSATTSSNSAAGCTGKYVFRVSFLPIVTPGSPPTEFTTDKEHRMVASETSIVTDSKRSTGCRGSHAKGSNVVVVHCNAYDTGSQSLEICNVVAADYSLVMQNEWSVPVSSIAKGNEGHRDGELIRDGGENINVSVHATQTQP